MVWVFSEIITKALLVSRKRAHVTRQLCEAHKENRDFLCAHLTLGQRACSASSPPSLCDDALWKQAAMLLDAVDSESMNNKTHESLVKGIDLYFMLKLPSISFYSTNAPG